MQTRRPTASRIIAGALACVGAFFALGTAQAEGAYFAVVPVSGSGTVGQLRLVKMALAGATPPAATVGVPYSFNLGALLSMEGPEGTTPDKVSWRSVSGPLPAGLELAGDRITGVPEEAFASSSVAIQAEYLSGYQRVEATRGYVFEVLPAGIADFGGYRAWEDGTFAQSCEGYIRPTAAEHVYAGAAGDGVYRIAPAGVTPFDVRCDMTTDGGGWTLVEYAADLPLAQRWTGDAWRWLPQNFSLILSNAQINAIRSLSTSAKQKYVGLCDGTIHYFDRNEKHYRNAIAFKFHTGVTSNKGMEIYTPDGIKVTQDGCSKNGGEGGALENATFFEIENLNLPVINIQTVDNGGGATLEAFGSPLTQYPARFR